MNNEIVHLVNGLRTYEVFVGKQSITPELLATFPHANFLDGMAAIPETDTLLIADPNLGRVWRINVKSKKIDVAIENNYTKPEPSTGIGKQK